MHLLVRNEEALVDRLVVVLPQRVGVVSDVAEQLARVRNSDTWGQGRLT